MPEANGITEGKFDEVRGKDVLVITGRFGFKTYDVGEPAKPKLLDEFIPNDLAAGGGGGYWQNEDMELDTKRKLDHRRARSSPYRQPAGRLPGRRKHREPGLQEAGSMSSPTRTRPTSSRSATSSRCRPGTRPLHPGLQVHLDRRPGAAQRPDRAASPTAPAPYTFNRLVGDGRPIWVTDLTNPAKPDVSDQPVDIWRNDGYTDYSHDVDEDDEGIAWVSGRGGVRGYATSGWHREPYTNRERKATPFEPILVAGGGVAGGARPSR